MSQITEILDREIKKDEQIKDFQKSLDKVKKERNHYFQQAMNGGKQ